MVVEMAYNQHLVYYLFIILLFSMLPALFNATDCGRRRGYCPVGLDCNRNNSLCENPQTRCGLGANRNDNGQGLTCSSTLPVCKPLQKDMEIIKNFGDALVIGAACAAVNQITIKSVFTYKSVLVTITNGTRQVANGVKFDLKIVVALSTTCKKDSALYTSVECPIDELTQQLWMVTVVATQTNKYNVLSIRQLMHIGSVSIKGIDERDFFLCSTCEKIVSYLESHLDNKTSRRAVKEILNGACNNLIVHKPCTDFVNKYFDKIWNAVVHKTLGKLCCDFQFCACKSNDAVKGAMNHTASHDDLCPEGFFCLTGDDCGSNSSLCKVGVCQRTKEENCVQGIIVQFNLNKYEVKENSGPVQLELTLSKPLEYCSTAVLVKVEDVTATGNVDYQFPRDGYIQVIVSGGVDRVPFNITIKDDNTLERAEFFRLSIVDVSLPSGVTVGSRHSTEVVIYDDDRGCVKIDRQTYSIRENSILQVTLSLSLTASYDIGVNVYCVDLNAKRYDYDPGPYRVTFRAGNRRATFKII